jgi:hypothetical protein
MRPLLFLAAIAFLPLAGCGPAKLDITKTYKVVPGDTQFVILPAQPKPQRITVEYEADQPVEIGVYKSDDVKDQDTALPTSKALKVEKATTTGTVAVDLNPDVSVTVTVTGLGKEAGVKLHITNRK